MYEELSGSLVARLKECRKLGGKKGRGERNSARSEERRATMSYPNEHVQLVTEHFHHCVRSNHVLNTFDASCKRFVRMRTILKVKPSRLIAAEQSLEWSVLCLIATDKASRDRSADSYVRVNPSL